MRDYSFQEEWKKLLQPDIVSMLTQIHEYKGRQTLFAEAEKDALTGLVEIAKIQSTEASNRIEGIYTSDERIKKLAMDKTTPHSRDEQEIAGYRDVLNAIHEDHDSIPLKPTVILQLHRDLYKYCGNGSGGTFKNSDNAIVDKDENGNEFVRFEPLSAWETPEAVTALCDSFAKAVSSEEADPLLLIPMFILDFLCIHPFNDGNGRMSRLITLLLLYRSGYFVGKYISVEKLIENTKETYYAALQISSNGWHDNRNDYAPFVRYMLGVILAAYRDFSERVMTVASLGLSKPERVEKIIRDTLGKTTKNEIAKQCPDISQTTISRALNELVKSGKILKTGATRNARYTYNHDRSCEK